MYAIRDSNGNMKGKVSYNVLNYILEKCPGKMNTKKFKSGRIVPCFVFSEPAYFGNGQIDVYVCENEYVELENKI